MKKTTIRVWLSALLFALLASIPFLVPHAGVISLFAFVPLFYLEQLARENNIRHTWWITYAAFLLFNIASTFWVWWVSPAGSIAAIALNALQMNIIFSLFRWSRRKMKGALPYLFFIATWIAWEHIYQNIEITWPWLILGNSFAVSPKLVQWYEYTGFLGGSLWILFFNALFYELLRQISLEPFVTEKYARRKRRSMIIGVIVALFAPIVASLVIYSNYEESSDPVEVVAVQPNIDSYTEKHGGLSQELQDQRLIDLAEEMTTPQTRYVITPETFSYALDLDNPDDNSTYRNIMAFLERHPDAEFLLGSLTLRFYETKAQGTPAASRIGQRWYDKFNSAMLIDSSGNFTCYHKSKLVPGVEIIPYQKYLGFLTAVFEKFGGASGSYGTQEDVSLLTSHDGTKVGAMICYESVYGEWFRRTSQKGANFITVITNDGWWGDTPGYRQHFRFARLRAIENRRDIVHVANTGITGFIDQRGEVLQRTGWWEPVAIRGTVNLNAKTTFFAENGDIVGRICCFIFCLMFLALLVGSVAKKRE